MVICYKNWASVPSARTARNELQIINRLSANNVSFSIFQISQIRRGVSSKKLYFTFILTNISATLSAK
jgi:hypothetical protein